MITKIILISYKHTN